MPARLTAAVGILAVALLASGRGAAAPAAEDDEPADKESADDTPKPTPAPNKPRAAPAPADEAPASAALPLVGFDDRLFIRSSGDEVVLFPSALLQVDAAFFPRQTPKSGAYLRRARVGLRGWLGRSFYFDVSSELAPAPPAADNTDAIAPSALPAADNYIAFAPARDRLIVQAGQFDAPFTLENRTSDAYTDFIERAMVARSLGVPRQKEVGIMVHGLLGGLLYYSAGAFNGEGPGFRNADNQPDAIGRVVVTPFGAGNGPFRRLSIGGSGWYGRHVQGPVFPAQATPGGVRFLVPRWGTGQTPPRTIEMREHGTVIAAGAEFNLPLGPRVGMRAEGVWKQHELTETDVAAPTSPLSYTRLDGLAGYGELWLWLLGNERQLPAPGQQLPLRASADGTRWPSDGLMFAVRSEFLKEDLRSNVPTLGNPTRATTRVVSGTAGFNYWYGQLVRVSVNYVLNMWSGTSETIKTLRAQGTFEHELLLRFAISL